MPELFVTFVRLLSLVLTLLILGRVIVSWTNPTGGGGFTAFLYQSTEPILAPIRRLVPPMGGFDLSPMIALVVLSLLTRALLG
jgi:YggT family protein